MVKHWLMLEAGPGPVALPCTSREPGTTLPSTHLLTEDLMASTRHHTHIELERLTGIHDRRVSLGEEDSLQPRGRGRPGLPEPFAPARLLDRGGHQLQHHQVPGRLTQWLEPTMSSAVAEAIGASGAMTFDLSNACAGMLTGVIVLNNWIRQGTCERGLVVSGEYISQLGQNAAHHVRNIMSRELASLTLGDAGAALLLERAPAGSAGISLAGFTTVADHSRLCLAYGVDGRSGRADVHQARGRSSRPPSPTRPSCCTRCSTRSASPFSDIDHVITHQTSARAIKKGMAEITEAFGDSPRHDAVISVDQYGNTASTTHTVALIDELEAGRISAGETVALIALASGLEIGIVLLALDEEVVAGYGHRH